MKTRMNSWYKKRVAHYETLESWFGDVNNIPAAVQDAILKNGLTPSDIAKQLNVDVSDIYGARNQGYGFVSYPRLVRICNFLELTDIDLQD